MISFFVPIYNEEENLNQFLIGLKKFSETDFNRQNDFIFVDDGSDDNSRKLLEKFIMLESTNNKFKLITQNKNNGVGYAFKLALEKTDKKFIFFLPSDNDLEFKDIENLKNYLDYDFIMLYPQNFSKYSRNRYLLSMLFRLIYCYTFNTKVNYIQAPCLYNVELLKTLNIKSNRFNIWPEINIKILRKKTKYIEIPVHFKNKSVIDRTVSIKNLLEIIKGYINLFIEIIILKK